MPPVVAAGGGGGGFLLDGGRGGGDPDLHLQPVGAGSRSQTRDSLEQSHARLYGPLRRVVRFGSTQTDYAA